jgi:Zn-dependent peptidase ImmA (M78 family)
MDYRSIERCSRKLLEEIFQHEQKLRPGLLAPVQMIEPEFVANFLDYDLAYVASLGSWGTGQSKFEIAGLLDQQRRIIRISERFPRQEGRFTAAHEIGHIALQHKGAIIHRDRTIRGIEMGHQDHQEREANYFAACLLAPKRLVLAEYEKRFPIGPPLPLTDDIAFHLCGTSAHGLMRAGQGSYDFAAAVASAKSFDRHQFRSLADSFNISVSAMAIRLRELHLLDQ